MLCVSAFALFYIRLLLYLRNCSNRILPAFAFFYLYLSPRIYYLLSLCSCQGTVVGSSGLEPPTSRLSGARSNQLSYEPVCYASFRVHADPRPSGRHCRLQRRHCRLQRPGGDERVRTAGLLLARQALYQLSYTPTLAHAYARVRGRFLFPTFKVREAFASCTLKTVQ